MLSLKDIIDFCTLSEGEVRAIAEHERLSEISAASLGQSLLRSSKDTQEIERFIREDMDDAELHGLVVKAKGLRQILTGFVKTHPFLPGA